MSVNLQKGQKVDLTKGNAGLKKIVVGLGWDPAQPAKSGFFGSLFGGQTQDVDVDAAAILCGANGKVAGGQVGKLTGDVVFFNNLTHKSGCVKHMGDNLTGGGDGDDEQIIVDLKGLPQQYEKIVFVVNIYQARERNQHFGMIKNAFIRIFNAENNHELCKFNLSENYDRMTAMVFGEVYRHQGEWKFSAIGQATTDPGITATFNRYV